MKLKRNNSINSIIYLIIIVFAIGKIKRLI